MAENNTQVVQLSGLQVHFALPKGPLDHLLSREARVVRAVDGVDLSIGRGETVALVGESGSGKSTVGRVIAKLVQPTGGQMVFEDQDVTAVQGHRNLRTYRQRVQMIFQDAYQALN